MTPPTMNIIQTIPMILMGSLNRIIPNNTVPIVPIPVQIAYAVPIDKLFKDNDKKQILATNPIIVNMLGSIFVNPWEYFKPIAQHTSKIPAITK